MNQRPTRQDFIKHLQLSLHSMGIKEIVYFHCDHFEPNSLDKSGHRIHEEHIAYFVSELKKTPIGKPSLFLGNMVFYIENATLHRATLEAPCSRILKVLTENEIDVQVHIHHEPWTISKTAPETCAEWLSDTLRSWLGYLAEHGIGYPVGWAFIHGCWALQGSDASICNIPNEIEILSKHGCYGDFSFPAGREHCNPETKYPFTVKSDLYGIGAYRAPSASPVQIGKHSGIGQPGRFFIWSSEVPNETGSLDLISLGSVSPYAIVASWLFNGPVIDNTLYIKTHAHSLSSEYWASRTETTTPLLSDKFKKSIDLLFEISRDVAPFHVMTVPDVVSHLASAERST